MSNQAKESQMGAWVIPYSLVKGNDKKELRKELWRAGCKWNNDANGYICPSAEVHAQYMAQLQPEAPKLELVPPAPPPVPGPPAVAPPPPPVAAAPAPPPVVAPPVPPAPPVAPPPVVEDTVGQVAAAVPVPAAVTSPEVEAEVTSEIEEQAERVLPMPPMMFFTARIEQPGDVHTIKRDQEETVTPGDEESGTVTVRKVVHTNERVVRNPEEREKGRKLISSMYSRLGRLGSKVGNCYLVPLKHKVKALAEIAAVRREAAVFNSTATHHYIRSVITTPMEVVASDEGLYARDVALKMQEITGQIKDALEACDVNKVRNLASEAATVVRIIGNGDAAKMEQMISSARAGANWINRELKKKEKDISEIRAEIKGSAVAAVESARLAFLEYAQPEEVKAIGSALGAAQMDLEVSEPAAEVQQVNNSDDGRFDL